MHSWICRSAGILLIFNGVVRGDDFEHFEKKIRPVLVRYCYECHSSASTDVKGGLRLDSRPALQEGGESGPVVVSGKPDESLLIQALRHESLEMPPDRKLPDAVVRDFAEWIEAGAPDPRDTPPDAQVVSQELWRAQFEQRRKLWSFQPVRDSAVSDVDNSDWSGQPIDRFILRRLEQSGLKPARRAEDRVLIRRLTFALTGLPPAPAEVDSFAEESNRNSERAWKDLVDRLLDSPHFGERWARHWMDVVRYTDTYGYEWDMPAKGAWRYRDYLIRAFNQDVPFDQLVREQIAGDLLEEPRINADEQINESIIGTMFFQMGEKRHGDSANFEGIHQEMLDNKIDAFSKAFQAITISCARCHDHKLDPISQAEYYALAGTFMSSRWISNTADLPERNADVLAKLKQLKAEIRPHLAAVWKLDNASLSELMTAGKSNSSPSLGTAFQNLMKERQEKPPGVEDALFVWTRLQSAESRQNVVALWNDAAKTYLQEQQKRAAHNAGHFEVIADFSKGIPDGWSVDGAGLDEVVRSGDFVLSLSGEGILDRVLPVGFFTNALSPKLNGAIRSPSWVHEFEQGHLSFEYIGGDFAAQRLVVDNAFLGERQGYLKAASPSWVRLTGGMKNRHKYIEFATKSSNPNFPPRVGLGGKLTDEQIADPRSWFGLTRVVRHVAPHSPQDPLYRFKPLFTDDAPKTLDEAAVRIAGWFLNAINNWEKYETTTGDVRILNWLLTSGLLTNRIDGKPTDDERRPHLDAIKQLRQEYRDTEARVQVPWTVNGMADLDPGFDYRLNIRGDYYQLGDEVPRRYIELLQGSTEKFRSNGSGRLELAGQVASPNNPLTARAFVNRVWHWLFGAGLVRTPSNFGALGERPSHPELLDWLTVRFVEDGWSLKKLIRRIVLTETWRQSGTVTEAARTADPDNRLLHHYPLRRLEAEAIRDAMLASSGRLDATLFGPTINPYRAKEDPQKRLFSGPVDGNGRRSIYTKVTIMEPPRFLSLFNQPKPKIPTGRRDITNTPAQALALLNDEFVISQSREWAQRLVKRDDQSAADRIQHMFRVAFGRKPDEAELNRWLAAIEGFSEPGETNSGSLLSSIAVWQSAAHAVFNTKEFLYLR